MSRAVTLSALALTAAVSFGLYRLSYRVQAQENTLLHLNRTLNRDREAIWVLKAEWSYLSRPDALQQEADRFLALQPLQPSQIVTEAQVAALPSMSDFPPPDTAVPLPLPRPTQDWSQVPVARREAPPPLRRAAEAAAPTGARREAPPPLRRAAEAAAPTGARREAARPFPGAALAVVPQPLAPILVSDEMVRR